MAPPRDSRIPAAPELEDAEARARQALGVQDRPVSRPVQQRPMQPRARHRFVQDGEVPVVVLHTTKPADAGPGSRIRAAEDALEAERSSHADTARALREAEATIQALETKLAHAELAHGEALAAEREARERAEQALREAMAAVAPPPGASAPEPPRRRGRPPRAAAAAETAGAEAAGAESVGAAPADAATADKPRRGRPPSAASGAKQKEPKPVKWWLPKRPAKR